MEKDRFWCPQCKQIYPGDKVELREVDTMFGDGRWWYCRACGTSLSRYPAGGGLTATEEDDFLAYDLASLLIWLGDPALTSFWSCQDVEAYGSDADDLHFYSDQGQRIAGQDLLEIVAIVDNIVDGRFSAFHPGETQPWLVVRAIDNYVYELESDEPMLARIKREPGGKPEKPAAQPAPAALDTEVGGVLPSPPICETDDHKPGYLAHIPEYGPLVESALTDFALQHWGSLDGWEYQERPVYRAVVRDFFDGRVIGTVSRKLPAPALRPRQIGSDRLCVALEGDTALEYRLRVFAFQDFAYFQLGHGYMPTGPGFTRYRASYLCLGVVHLNTEIAYPALSKGIRELYDYLKTSPVDLLSEGYDNPAFVDQELWPGLWLTISLWAKHT